MPGAHFNGAVSLSRLLDMLSGQCDSCRALDPNTDACLCDTSWKPVKQRHSFLEQKQLQPKQTSEMARVDVPYGLLRCLIPCAL